jgi:hypothetical protein
VANLLLSVDDTRKLIPTKISDTKNIDDIEFPFYQMVQIVFQRTANVILLGGRT